MVYLAYLICLNNLIMDTGLKIPALERWTDEYLTSKMDDRQISVAVTPNGSVQKPVYSLV